MNPMQIARTIQLTSTEKAVLCDTLVLALDRFDLSNEEIETINAILDKLGG